MNQKLNLRLSRFTLLTCAAVWVSRSHATDGYFDYGYGIKAKGMGGTGVTDICGMAIQLAKAPWNRSGNKGEQPT